MILNRLSKAIRKQDWFTVVLEFVIVVFGIFNKLDGVGPTYLIDTHIFSQTCGLNTALKALFVGQNSATNQGSENDQDFKWTIWDPKWAV